MLYKQQTNRNLGRSAKDFREIGVSSAVKPLPCPFFLCFLAAEETNFYTSFSPFLFTTSIPKPNSISDLYQSSKKPQLRNHSLFGEPFRRNSRSLAIRDERQMSQHHHSNSYTSSFNAIYSHSYSQSFSTTRQIGNGRTRRPQRPPPLDSTFQGPSTSFHQDASSSDFPTSFSEPDFRSFSSDTNLLQRNHQQSFSRENSQTTLSNSTSSSSLSYHLSANPEDSTSILFSEDGAEDDDEMHEPEPGSFSYDPKSSQRKVERESARGTIFTKRGILNLSTIALLIIAILALFIG